METRRPPEYNIDVLADRSNVKDVVKALLHTIFFYRYFPPTSPSTHEILDLTLPYLPVSEITALIDTRVSPYPATYLLQFLERKRKKATGLGWFGGSKSSDDEQVWENWVVNVQVPAGRVSKREMERSLQKAVMKVLGLVGRERGHIPPITTNETNPFPFQILVRKEGEAAKEGWGRGIGGIF